MYVVLLGDAAGLEEGSFMWCVLVVWVEDVSCIHSTALRDPNVPRGAS